MALLPNRDRPVISKHVDNALKKDLSKTQYGQNLPELGRMAKLTVSIITK